MLVSPQEIEAATIAVRRGLIADAKARNGNFVDDGSGMVSTDRRFNLEALVARALDAAARARSL